MTYIDINKVVDDNYESIKNKTYKWKDNEIKAIYKLAYNALRQYGIQQEELDDCIEDCIYVFFSKVLVSYDKNLGNNISTMATIAFRNNYLMNFRSSTSKMELVSMEKEISEDLKLGDIVYDEDSKGYNPEIEDAKIIFEYLKEKFDEDSYVYMKYVKEMSFKEIAKIKNSTPQAVRNKVANDIAKFASDQKVKNLMKK